MNAAADAQLVEALQRRPGAGYCRIIAFALNPWDGQWMNRQQLLSRLVQQHEIIYSNGPWQAWDFNRPEAKAAGWLGGFEHRAGVWLDRSPRALLGWPRHPRWNVMVRRLVARRWQRKLDSMGSGPVIAYVFHPDLLHYAELVRADRLIYHAYDMYSHMPGWTTERETEHRRLLDKCDLVIASSRPLRDELQAMTRASVAWVPNGVDAQAFINGSTQAEPPDLARIPRPRLGYVGTLNRKVDFNLIAELATRRPDWNFVLSGPIGSLDSVSETALARCRSTPNVHVLPEHSLAELPAVMAALDVGLMCYRRDTWMDYGYPLKLHEYQASGLPVVSTPLQALVGYEQWVDMATDCDGWQAALDRALTGQLPHGREERQAEARRNSWDLRVQAIDRLLSTCVATPPRQSPATAPA